MIMCDRNHIVTFIPVHLFVSVVVQVFQSINDSGHEGRQVVLVHLPHSHLKKPMSDESVTVHDGCHLQFHWARAREHCPSYTHHQELEE